MKNQIPFGSWKETFKNARTLNSAQALEDYAETIIT
jgi:hypothetical protein